MANQSKNMNENNKVCTGKCEVLCNKFSWIKNENIGLLITRVVFGAIFITAGWGKIFGEYGVDGFANNFDMSVATAWLVALIELVGGVAIVLGAFTRVAALLVTTVVLGIICTINFPEGFSGDFVPKSIQYHLMLLATAVSLIFSGAGKYSLGAKCCKMKCGTDDKCPCC